MNRKEKIVGFLERSPTFSLEFPAIGPSDPGEPRDKVAPHCKSYEWVPVLWSFDNYGRLGSSPTWLLLI